MNKVRRSCYAAVVALLCLTPGALAQRASLPLSTSMNGATVGRPAALVVFPFNDQRRKKKRVAAPEGGATALYLALAAACCFGAIFVRSRAQQAEKAV